MNEKDENQLRDETGSTGTTSPVAGSPMTDPATAALPTPGDRSGFSRYLDYAVMDKDDKKIGTLHALWVDRNGQPAFLGIKTGWLFGKTHVIPAQAAEVSEGGRKIRLRFGEDMIKNAPAYDADRDLDPESERRVIDYFHLGGTSETTESSEAFREEPFAGEKPRFSTEEIREPESTTRFTPGEPETTAAEPRREAEEARIPLSEEELKVGKRQVESGGVRLRKIVKTEVVTQPVELAHEEIVIERVPAEGAQTGEAFSGQEVYIPLRREEPVVQKESHVREEVRARKQADVERRDISEGVRREDVEIQHEGDANVRGPERSGQP